VPSVNLILHITYPIQCVCDLITCDDVWMLKWTICDGLSPNKYFVAKIKTGFANRYVWSNLLFLLLLCFYTSFVLLYVSALCLLCLLNYIDDLCLMLESRVQITIQNTNMLLFYKVKYTHNNVFKNGWLICVVTCDVGF